MVNLHVLSAIPSCHDVCVDRCVRGIRGISRCHCTLVERPDALIRVVTADPENDGLAPPRTECIQLTVGRVHRRIEHNDVHTPRPW